MVSLDLGNEPPFSGQANPRVAIIGAGMTGILAGIKLKESGNSNFVIYEKAEKLGGTWHHNTYPGLTCDVPSHFYRYAFEPNPDWSRYQAPGQEIWDYLDRVARKYGIESHIQYRREVTKLTFHQDGWLLDTKDGTKERFNFVLAATGFLHKPSYPSIPGRETFRGDSFHTAAWKHEVPLDNKTIGVIGTGSSAVQVICALTSRVKTLKVFQRTAQWVWPVPNPLYTEEQRAEFRNSPELLEKTYRDLVDWFNKTFAQAVIGDEVQIGYIERSCKKHLESIKDPVLRAKLTPDYRVLCKRLVMSAEFYAHMQKPNVELITDRIQVIEDGGIRTADGVLHALDVIVYATGFDAHAYAKPIRIIGCGGMDLDEVWRERRAAYLSLSVPDFPNFFFIGGGPNSPVGNFSAYLVSEAQVGYVMQLIELVRNNHCKTIEATREATQEFVEAADRDVSKTVWVTGGCHSWYQDEKGHTVMWPWSFQRFLEENARPRLENFKLQ